MKTRDVALGSIYGMLSRVIMLVCGFLVHIVLARKLGPEFFGLYTLILSFLVWVESSASLGLPSVFRKIISEKKTMFRPIVTSLGKLSVPYCLTTMLVFVLVSPLIASTMNDSRLILLLIIGSLDIPFFVMYATYLGVLNGHGEFLLHSALAALYSLSRAVLIVAGVVFGLGITGALIGNAIGSMCGLLLAFFYTRKLTDQYAPVNDGSLRLSSPVIKSRLVSFGVPYLSYSLLTSVLINMDIWFVKALSETTGAADEVVGYYAAAYNLARIPYLLMTGITMTIFPAISNAVFENRMQDAQKHIKQMLRLALLILIPAILIIYSTADGLISLVFSSAYLPGGDSLRILFAGVCAFSIFMFFVNIIAAENKPNFALLISIFLIPAGIALNYFLIKALGILGAAVATTVVSTIGLVISGAYVWHRFGPVIDAYTLVRILIASGGVFLASRYQAFYQFGLLFGYAVLGLIYGLLLLVLRETDLKTVRSVLRSLMKPSTSS